MAETPFEHEVLAEATNLTDVPTELPLVGLLTVTPANAEIEARKRIKIKMRLRTNRGVHRGACLGMSAFLPLDEISLLTC
jgi:hypothetical protein